MPLVLVCVLQGKKVCPDDETKRYFPKNTLSLEWPEERPACRADALGALEWRASVSHAEAKSECLLLLVPSCLNGSLEVGARERTTLEIEEMGERCKNNGTTSEPSPRALVFLRCRFVGQYALNVPSCCRLFKYLDTCGLERDVVFVVVVNSDHEEWID